MTTASLSRDMGEIEQPLRSVAVSRSSEEIDFEGLPNGHVTSAFEYDGYEAGTTTNEMSYNTLLGKLKAFESRIAYLEGDQKTDYDIHTVRMDQHDDTKDDVDDKPKSAGSTQKLIILPEVRKCNVADFKNRFGKHNVLYAVDVLVAGPLVEQEIQEELKRRQELPKRRAKGKGKSSKNKSSLPDTSAANLIDLATHTKQSEDSWPQRIRIQSPAILAILARIVRESWSCRPRTFFRPFSLLIYFHDGMKDALRELESRWGHLESLDPSPTPQSRDGGSHQGLLEEQQYQVDESPAALREMRAYIHFMDQEIMPHFTQFRECDAASKAKVRFDDLWYLFRTGELVYMPVAVDSEKANYTATRQLAWRVYGIRQPVPKYRITPTDIRRYGSHAHFEDDSDSDFILYCYYIDYTGDEYCIVRDKFKILPYKGECPVRQLSIYPFHFVPDYKNVLKEFDQCGRDFLHYVEVKHAKYNYWTLTVNPNGDPAIDQSGVEIKHPEHVDSEVIVDFVEAFQTCPSWKPKPSILKPRDPDPSTTADDFFIKCWSDADRTKLVSETVEIIQLRSGVDTYEHNKQLEKDGFLSNVRENDKNCRLTSASYLRPDDIYLLPIRVFAYALQDRKFVQLDVQKLRPVKESHNAFDCLKIRPKYKETIQALVEAHFMKKIVEREGGVEGMTQDLIQGKGKGLFILLHGVPGVGKTATAEAVAQANGKPLFAITCGDLGLTPKEVESSLSAIFRLANIWDCVLLLDEVDTFFSQRSKVDANITKNALVSVFLRVLEYYNGILFLTTNRPGALDEAFKSRIHLALYYPPLTSNQNREIWKMNIERLKAIEEMRCQGSNEQPLQIFEDEIMAFAIAQYQKNSEGRELWNGRQIRNAFQLAASLAYYDARKKYAQIKERHPDTQPLRPKLDVEHFNMIHMITDSFEQYMELTLGKPASELAQDAGDRYDQFTPRPIADEAGYFNNTGNPVGSVGRTNGSNDWSGSYLVAGHMASGQRHSSTGRRGDGLEFGSISSDSPPAHHHMQFTNLHTANQHRPPIVGALSYPLGTVGPNSHNYAGGHVERDYPLHGGPVHSQAGNVAGRPHGSVGSTQGYNPEYTPSTSQPGGGPQVGPTGFPVFGREGHAQGEYGHHGSASAHGFGQAEYSGRKMRGEESDDY